MIGTIGDTLWIALGIALNPIAIVLSILIANRADPRRNGIAYLLGWLCGLALLVALPALLLHERLGLLNGVVLKADLQGKLSLFRAGLGIVLLIAAAAALLKGPLPGDRAADPRWLRLIENGGVARVFGMGAFVSTVNIRNLILLAAAASIIGQADLEYLRLAVAIAIFVTVATLGVLLPLLLHLVAGDASEARLKAWGDWLTRNMGVITGVIMALFGALLLTSGVRGAL